MAHQLKIKIEDIGEEYIRFEDISQYDKHLTVENRVFRVDVPGYPGFKLPVLPVNDFFYFTSKSLGLSSKMESLPDGLWRTTLSVCPNEKVFDTSFHYRTVRLEAYMASMISCEKISDIQLVNCYLKLKSLKSVSIDAFNVSLADQLYNEIYDFITKNVN